MEWNGYEDGYSLIGNDRFSSNINGENPKFMDWETYDFQLDTLSPAKDVGLDIGILLDNLGRNRNANPDIGAFERIEN